MSCDNKSNIGANDTYFSFYGCGQHRIVSNLNLIPQTTKLNDLPIFPIVQ